MDIDMFIDMIMGCEGGYSNYFVDWGGVMCWGVMEVVVCVYGYCGDMCVFFCVEVVVIYCCIYWQ